MSRRPPSARDPRMLVPRTLPALQRVVPGHLQARAAQPLPRPLPNRSTTPSRASTVWTPELIFAGFARVATNIVPPGLRVPFGCTLTAIYFRVGTAPTGASLVAVVKKGGTTLATLTIAASGTSTSLTGLTAFLAAGDAITMDLTGIGSTIAGADLALQLITA